VAVGEVDERKKVLDLIEIMIDDEVVRLVFFENIRKKQEK
jgi:hypothetical protein